MAVEKKLIVQYPSFLPRGMGVFRPVDQNTEIISGELFDQSLMQLYSHVHLINPPKTVLKNLTTAHVEITFNQLPDFKAFPLQSELQIKVPSMYFRSVLKQNNIASEVVSVVPEMPQFSMLRQKIRHEYELHNNILFYMDERLINPDLHDSTFSILRKALAGQHRVKVFWVGKNRQGSSTRCYWISEQEADEQQVWLGSDWMLCALHPDQSTVFLQMQCLRLGIPLMTLSHGDHGEWVNHLFSGFLIGEKDYNKELQQYIKMGISQPSWLNRFRRNGRELVLKRVGHG